jgi:hypothetical protein
MAMEFAAKSRQDLLKACHIDHRPRRGYETMLIKHAGKRPTVGDRVTIEMSPYDLQKGRLIFRHKS